jgi:hypothetical protein
MATSQDCIKAIQQAAGRDLTDDELADLVQTLQERQKAIQATNQSLSTEEAALKAADELGRDAQLAALIEKRNAYINFRRRSEAIAYIRNTWKDRYDLGLESFLVGTNVARTGARRSVAAEQKELSQSYIAGLLNDLDKANLLPMITEGSSDREITRALWQLNQDNPDLKGFSKDVVESAKLFRKWQDTARIDANRAGAFIGKLDNYVTRQTHDPYKLQAAGFRQWADHIIPRLDPATLANVKNPEEFLLKAYNGLVSGVHLKTAQGPSGFKGPRNLAKKLSQERVLHFKDADSWFEYNQEFGTGSLREAIIGGLDHLGESTALMRKLGTNPESNWNQILERLQNDLKDDPVAMRKFSTDQRGMLTTRFKEVDGTARIPVDGIWARRAANARAWESMAKLGGAVVSAVSDLPVAASEMSYQGRSFLSSLGELMGGLVAGRKSAEKREILSSLGVFFDAMRGDVVSRFSADDSLGGRMSRAQRLFFKANGLTWWTDTVRSSAALMMSHNLALHTGKPFDQLGDLARTLNLYGIDAKRWDLLRKAPASKADGQAYLTTEGVDAIPDATLEAYLGRADKPALRELRSDLKSQLRAFITDRASYAVIEPDARTRAIMRRGTQPGTVAGELLRFIGQFKAFPVAILQKTVGRELYGRGYTPSAYGANPLKELAQALKNGNGEKLGLAQLLLWTTAFGYLAMSAKDMLKGRSPRDPANPHTWVASMLQGGALGIYGDYLFGEVNRFGGSPIQTAAGPVLGAAEDMVTLYNKVRTGDDAAASTFRFALNNTPFLNLFYSRIALDYLVLYQMQESMNPGYLRRMERRVEKENSQTFLLRPSQVVNQ